MEDTEIPKSVIITMSQKSVMYIHYKYETRNTCTKTNTLIHPTLHKIPTIFYNTAFKLLSISLKNSLMFYK